MSFANGRPVSSLDDKRRERAGFDRLAVLETPDADLVAERDRVDAAWEVWAMPPKPSSEGEAKQLVIARVDDARTKLREAVDLFDRISDASTRETIAEAEDCISAITASLVVKWGVR